MDDLHRHCPRRPITAFNGIEQVLDVIVGLLSSKLQGHISRKRLDPASGFEMPFDVNKTTILVLLSATLKTSRVLQTHLLVQGVGMDTISVDVPQRRGNATLPKKVHKSVDALWVVNVKVPEHARVWDIRPRMPLVAPIHAGELDRIADEEDWKIIENKVLIAFFGVELCGPATDIANCVAGAFLAGNRGDTCQDLRLLPYAGEELGIGKIGDIVSDLELAPGSGGFGVDTSMRPLAAWS